jgi:transcriptional regulator with XRE-family HTH domain
MNELGTYIADKRNALRLTQKEVVERMRLRGVNRDATTLANWEAGRQVVPLEVLPVLAEALEENSPTKLYDYAGILSTIPGSGIVRLLDGQSPETVERVERMIAALLENNK